MSPEPTSFLYPFIEAEESDAPALLAVLARSASEKVAASARLRAETLERCAQGLAAAASAIALRFARGGRLFALGNGGSATDADALVERLVRPAAGRALPALSLLENPAVLTALGNDIGFEAVFSRQLIAFARPGDIAVGISTSGTSTNVLSALAEAQRLGLLTVGVCGYDGGAMAIRGLDHCIVVRSDSVHRIQETQDAVLSALCRQVRACLERGTP